MRISKTKVRSPLKKMVVFNAQSSLEADGVESSAINKINAGPDRQVIIINTEQDRSQCKSIPVTASTHLELCTPKDWPAVLQLATDKKVGLIVLSWLSEEIFFKAEEIRKAIPLTVPGQLLAFLHARFKAFDGKEAGGLEIIFTTFSTGNTERIKAFLVELAHLNGLEYTFLDWLEKVSQLIVEP